MLFTDCSVRVHPYTHAHNTSVTVFSSFTVWRMKLTHVHGLFHLENTFQSPVPDLLRHVIMKVLSVFPQSPAVWSPVKCNMKSAYSHTVSAQRRHTHLVETVWWAGLTKYCVYNYYYIEWVKRSIDSVWRRTNESGAVQRNNLCRTRWDKHTHTHTNTHCTTLLLERRWTQTWRTERLWAEEKEKREGGRRTRTERWARHSPRVTLHSCRKQRLFWMLLWTLWEAKTEQRRRQSTATNSHWQLSMNRKHVSFKTVRQR